MRTYTAKPGALRSWLSVYEETRLPILKQHLGRLVAAFIPDTGNINQLVQIWEYENAEDREQRRAALWADPAWTDPKSNTAEALVHQESVLLKPTSFSPLK
ncbi:NIPSNAP family protein [Tropicibacter sp. Alg240-R139]|uniref:NIPSNAP family protein n=1 Tax=Tropicibacter sp. Alg240-R139 TaxID=2305991 RepID=UPI00196761C7|nr:NIPSNAP family protein [Tropicibacter sp. Alg240-R139]